MAGKINHVEFPADDLERAKTFYSAVAGWQFNPMPGYEDYWLFQSDEQSGGGIGTRGASVAEKLRIYITVDNIEQALAASDANGGTRLGEIQDVPGQGRFSAVRDPEGNEVGLWENAASTS